MSQQTFYETLIEAQSVGPTLTSAAAATCLPAHARKTIPANMLRFPGQTLLLKAAGIISCVVTTPGTARFDFRLGGTVVADSLAMNLNIVAKTSVNWVLEMIMTLRVVGSSAQFWMQGYWASEAGIGAPLPTVGGSAFFTLPYGQTPVLGTAFDATAAQQADCFYTQTVGTAGTSLTLETFTLALMN